MSVESQAASITAASTVHTHAANFQIMKVFIEAVKTLSLDSSYQQASAILDENTRLSKQISTKNEELAALNEKIKNVEMARDTTYGEMFEANQKEKNKCAEASKEVGSFKATIQEKEKMVADQKKIYDDISQQLENLRASYKKEHNKVLRANQDIDGLQQNLKSKDSRIEDLRVAGSKIKQAYARLETQVKELEGKNASLEKTLRNDSARLHELEGYAAPYCEEEGNALVDTFVSLWEFASEEIVVHLKKDLPAENLQNHQAWKKLKMPSNLPYQVPLPQTNSTVAKQMRLAVILAILAREINEQIFQPAYLSLEENDIREVLVDLATRHHKKESFCRGMLLSIDLEKQAICLEERKKAVVRNVGSCLLDLLSPTQYHEVRKSLEDIVQRAAEVWKSFQHTIEKYEPDFDPLKWGDDESEPFVFADINGTTDGARADGTLDEILLIVFPRICRVRNNECVPCSFVTALKRSQCFAAERELRKREPSSPSSTRSNPDRQRMQGLSISLNQRNHQDRSFLEKTSLPGVQSNG